MNNWHNEYMAEYQRQQILEQRKQIQIEELARSTAVYRPGLFSRTMFHFANWMIATGSRIRKRYEAPVPSYTAPPQTAP